MSDIFKKKTTQAKKEEVQPAPVQPKIEEPKPVPEIKPTAAKPKKITTQKQKGEKPTETKEKVSKFELPKGLELKIDDILLKVTNMSDRIEILETKTPAITVPQEEPEPIEEDLEFTDDLESLSIIKLMMIYQLVTGKSIRLKKKKIIKKLKEIFSNKPE